MSDVRSLESPIEYLSVSQARILLQHKNEVAVQTVHVGGILNKCSEIIREHTEVLFLMQLTDPEDDGRGVSVIVKKPEHLSLRNDLSVTEGYIFTNLKPTTLYKGSKDETRVFTPWMDAALVSLSEGVETSLKDFLKDSCSKQKLDELAEQHSCIKEYAQLISYQGIITSTSDARRGVFDLDNSVRLHVNYLPAVHGYRHLTEGERVTVHNAHVHKNQQRIHLYACSVTSIETSGRTPTMDRMGRPSRVADLIQKYSLTGPEADWLHELWTTLQQQFYPRHVSEKEAWVTLQEILKELMRKDQSRSSSKVKVTKKNRRNLMLEFLDPTHRKCSVLAESKLNKYTLMNIRKIKEVASRSGPQTIPGDTYWTYSTLTQEEHPDWVVCGVMKFCKKTGHARLVDQSGSVDICVLPSTEENTEVPVDSGITMDTGDRGTSSCHDTASLPELSNVTIDSPDFTTKSCRTSSNHSSDNNSDNSNNNNNNSVFTNCAKDTADLITSNTGKPRTCDGFPDSEGDTCKKRTGVLNTRCRDQVYMLNEFMLVTETFTLNSNPAKPNEERPKMLTKVYFMVDKGDFIPCCSKRAKQQKDQVLKRKGDSKVREAKHRKVYTADKRKRGIENIGEKLLKHGNSRIEVKGMSSKSETIDEPQNDGCNSNDKQMDEDKRTDDLSGRAASSSNLTGKNSESATGVHQWFRLKHKESLHVRRTGKGSHLCFYAVVYFLGPPVHDTGSSVIHKLGMTNIKSRRTESMNEECGKLHSGKERTSCSSLADSENIHLLKSKSSSSSSSVSLVPISSSPTVSSVSVTTSASLPSVSSAPVSLSELVDVAACSAQASSVSGSACMTKTFNPSLAEITESANEPPLPTLELISESPKDNVVGPNKLVSISAVQQLKMAQCQRDSNLQTRSGSASGNTSNTSTVPGMCIEICNQESERAKTKETSAGEVKTNGEKVAEMEITKTKSLETKVAKTKMVETKLEGTKIAETNIAEAKVAETNMAERVLLFSGDSICWYPVLHAAGVYRISKHGSTDASVFDTCLQSQRLHKALTKTKSRICIMVTGDMIIESFDPSENTVTPIVTAASGQCDEVEVTPISVILSPSHHENLVSFRGLVSSREICAETDAAYSTAYSKKHYKESWELGVSVPGDRSIKLHVTDTNDGSRITVFINPDNISYPQGLLTGSLVIFYKLERRVGSRGQVYCKFLTSSSYQIISFNKQLILDTQLGSPSQQPQNSKTSFGGERCYLASLLYRHPGGDTCWVNAQVLQVQSVTLTSTCTACRGDISCTCGSALITAKSSFLVDDGTCNAMVHCEGAPLVGSLLGLTSSEWTALEESCLERGGIRYVKGQPDWSDAGTSFLETLCSSVLVRRPLRIWVKTSKARRKNSTYKDLQVKTTDMTGSKITIRSLSILHLQCVAMETINYSKLAMDFLKKVKATPTQ